jgi:hypothetical protein
MAKILRLPVQISHPYQIPHHMEDLVDAQMIP